MQVPFFTVSNYNVWFVIGDCSVSLHLADSTVWSRYLLDLFLLILVHVRTNVFLYICTPISLHMLKGSCALTLSCRFTYCSFAIIIIIIIAVVVVVVV